MYSVRNYNPIIREAYTEYLKSLEWDYFTTVTFRHERKDSLAAIRDVSNTIIQPGCCHRAFLAAEPHQSGMVHLHGLLLADFEGKWSPKPYAFNVQDRLYFEFGLSRVEPARGEYSVANYCSKYVVKNNNIYEYAFLGDKHYW